MNATPSEADKYAAAIFKILTRGNDCWISVAEALPEGQPLSEPDAEYYKVKTEHFGEQIAMYLIGSNGVPGWYPNYISKLIIPVTHFKPVI